MQFPQKLLYITATGSELLSSARRTFDPVPFRVTKSIGTHDTSGTRALR